VGALALLSLMPTVEARSNKGCGTAAVNASSTQCKANVRNVLSRPPSRITLGIGDVVSVTIFEAEPGGLFIPSEPGARLGNFDIGTITTT
jgi:protein involved in polysaccharide export with SLBB domain